MFPYKILILNNKYQIKQNVGKEILLKIINNKWNNNNLTKMLTDKTNKIKVR